MARGSRGTRPSAGEIGTAMKPRPRAKKLVDGQLSRPSKLRKNGTYVHLLICCDCKLRHLVQYVITSRGLRFRAWRLNKGRVKK